MAIFLTFSCAPTQRIVMLMSYHLLVNSDHCLVSVDVSFQSPGANALPIHRTVYQYGKADWDGFRDFLNNAPWSYVLSLDPNSTAAELNEWISVEIDVFIPSKKFQLKAHSQPWFTPANCCCTCSNWISFHSGKKRKKKKKKKKKTENAGAQVWGNACGDQKPETLWGA